MKTPRFFLLLLLGICFLSKPFVLMAQNKKEHREEEKIHLLHAQEAEMYELFGVNYRKVTGPARFLHNNTLILCDTALWNTKENSLDAVGNIEIIQDGTKLTGETIHYLGDANIAEVRGKVVELIDKDNNRLRTKYLNFNTKDSIGYFFNGASMFDKDSTVLESRRGYYYSKEKLFCFYENVEIGTDTLKIKADSLYFHSDINFAEFWGHVQAWHADGFLTSGEGSYDKDKEWLHFKNDVLILTEKQEIRAHDIFYDRNNLSGTLRKDIQVRDTTQHTLLLADRLDFTRQPDWVQATEDPVWIAYEKDQETLATDSLFLRADTLRVFTTTYGAMDSLERTRALARQSIPVREKKAAVADTAQTLMPADSTHARLSEKEEPEPEPEQTDFTIDTTDVQKALFHADSLLLADARHLGDSLLQKTEVHMLYAYHRVKAYKSDLQSVCDSMVFNSIDSILRQYGKPVLWNEESQLSADSIWFRFSRDSLYRVDFSTNAFLISQEETFYHQIKGDLMLAHITDNDVYKFDVLKNARALFYIPEDSLITSLNIKECDAMHVFLKDKRAQRIVYKQSVKSDVIPLYDLRKDQERLAGFNWREEERPPDRQAITERIIIDMVYEPELFYKEPLFPYTLQFFPLEYTRSAFMRGIPITEARSELRNRESTEITEPIRLPEKTMRTERIPEDKRKSTPVTERKQLQLKSQELIQL